MELFKFNDQDLFLNGQAINGYDSIAWTERYRDPGDFEIVAKLSSGLREFLPEGSLISHTNSMDVMMVENVQIKDAKDTDPTVVITGRSIVAFLEQRIVGQNWDWSSPPASLSVSQYVLSANYTWIQAMVLINDHIGTGIMTIEDRVPTIQAVTDVSLAPGVSEARTLARGNVLRHLLDIMAIDDIGCRIERRHGFPWPDTELTDTTYFVIHDGVDLSDNVIFSVTNGDVDAADYLWSIKSMKNSALVTGKFVETMVEGPESGFNRRVMHVDGGDLDGYLESVPTGATLTSIRAAMTVRGNQALKRQKRLAISRIDIAETPRYRYRQDYSIGDIVSVDSSYGTVDTMRVVEHVEIMDESGGSSHPTLEMINP